MFEHLKFFTSFSHPVDISLTISLKLIFSVNTHSKILPYPSHSGKDE